MSQWENPAYFDNITVAVILPAFFTVGNFFCLLRQYICGVGSGSIQVRSDKSKRKTEG